MNFIKRALRAVSRRKVKSLLILVIFFVIANLVLAGFAIREATSKAQDAARQELGATLTLSYDLQKKRQEAMQSMQDSGGFQQGGGSRPQISMETEPVTEEMAALVGELAHVLYYNYNVSNVSASAEDFDPVEITFTQPDGAQAPPDGGGNGNRPSMNFTMPDVTLTGVRSSLLQSSFDAGTYTLEDGDHFEYSEDSDELPVLVEQSLATQNGLAVGDTITIGIMADSDSEDDAGTEDDAASTATYVLTVKGIYSAGNSDSQSGGMGFNQSYNQLIVDYKTALAVKEQSSGYTMGGMMGSSADGIDSVTYYVDDPVNVEAVQAAAQSLAIDWDSFVLDANSAAYEAMIAPLESVASTSSLIVVIVAIAGVIILALILAMWIRERMYETGVLLSLGESKLKIAFQYAGEVLVVALVAFGISIFSGMLISQQLGDFLISSQSASSSSTGDAMTPGGMQGMAGPGGQGGFGGRQSMFGGLAGSNTANVEAISSLEVDIGLSTIAKLFGIGLLLVLAATMIPTVLVMRYKPKDILVRAG